MPMQMSYVLLNILFCCPIFFKFLLVISDHSVIVFVIITHITSRYLARIVKLDIQRWSQNAGFSLSPITV